MTERLINALVAHLSDINGCPSCGSFGSDTEHFDPTVFDFVFEARFSCGSAVKVSKTGTLDVGTACPEALRDRLDQIEENIREDLDEDPA